MADKEALPQVVVIQQPSRTQYVDRHVTITENRAPTDDSVKLLREMEAKAEAEVVKAVSVSNTHFACVVHQHLDMMSDRVKWKAIFKLNGKTMLATTETDPRKSDRHYSSMRENFACLRDEMAKVIAEEVLTDAFIATMNERFNTRET
jgi:hypothetical protein